MGSSKIVVKTTIAGFVAVALLRCLGTIGMGAPAKEGHEPDLGVNTSLHGKQVLPPESLWNLDITRSEVDPNSQALLASIGLERPLHPDFGTVYNGAPMGIPYTVVSGTQAKVAIKFTDYGDESDAGPYPFPKDAPVEGGLKSDGDRHVLVLDKDNWVLYETWRSFPQPDGTWKAACGAIFDLKKNKPRQAGWTSSDAAGLPVFPGLVRYDEVVENKEVTHAVRFTVQHSTRAYVPPASHWASRTDDKKLPPMGMRVRLKADVDISKFPASAQVILTGLKKYGMIVADNGGNWFISGAPDPRWNDDELNTLKKIKGKDFDVIKMDGLVAARK